MIVFDNNYVGRCDCEDAQIASTTQCERWTINVIAGYSATTIAIDDD